MNGAAPWWIILGATGIFMLMFGILKYRAWLERNHEPVRNDHASDSPEFGRALNVWLALVLRVSGNSPRQLKRFLNETRFLSYLMHPSNTDGTTPISAPLIVALTAMRRFSGGNDSLHQSASSAFSSDPHEFWEWADSKIARLAKERRPQDPESFVNELRRVLDTAMTGHHKLTNEEVTCEHIEEFNKNARNIVTR